MNIRYNKSHKKTLEKIAKDIKESEDYKYFFPDIMETAKKHEFYMVYEKDDLIGFFFITKDSFGMYVVPKFRNRGFGGRMVEDVKDMMYDRDKIYANVTTGNKVAYNLYKKHGFVTTHVGLVNGRKSIRMTYDCTTNMKLNLGCGFQHVKGHINIDMNPNVQPDLKHDLREGIPFDDNTVISILAKDFLEHLPREKTIFFWNEMYRVCKDKALLTIVVPYAGSDLYYADPTHMTGYRYKTFQELTKPNELMGYKGKMELLNAGRNEETQNIMVQMQVIK